VMARLLMLSLWARMVLLTFGILDLLQRTSDKDNNKTYYGSPSFKYRYSDKMELVNWDYLELSLTLILRSLSFMEHRMRETWYWLIGLLKEEQLVMMLEGQLSM
jgi:hypothetical protein